MIEPATRISKPPAAGEAAEPPARAGAGKVGVVFTVGVTMAAAVFLHVPGFDGADYHPWYYRRMSGVLYLLMTLAATPFFLGLWLGERRGQISTALALMMAATVALQVVAMIPQPLGIGRIPAIIENGVNTSYYSAAVVLVQQQEASGTPIRAWLAAYPEMLDFFPVHARYKPPGLVLFYVVLIQLFGIGGATPSIAAGLIAIGAACAVPATYAMCLKLGGDRGGAFYAASYMALCPSLLLFFPQFDQVYPAVACVMILTWHQALVTRRTGWAIGYGAVLALATFLSYILLAVGASLAAYTLLFAGRHGRAGVNIIARAALIALLVVAGFYGMLWLWSGFDPLATFRQINLLQMADQVHLGRPFPMHMLLDVADVAMATGWISVPLIGFLLTSGWRSLTTPQRTLVFLGLFQFTVMAASALLPGEAARLWLYLLPLLMAPIGYELARWSFRQRLAVFVLLLLVGMTIGQNLTFLNMGDIDLPTRDVARLKPSSGTP